MGPCSLPSQKWVYLSLLHAGFKGQDELFQMFAYPTSFFVDREGHVLGSVMGAAPQQYRDTVEQLLKEVE